MTLNAITLDDYFHLIIKPSTQKETTMFDKTKMFFTQCLEKINSLLTKPTAFVDTVHEIDAPDDYWYFEMHTGEWSNEHGETVKAKHTYVMEPNDTTWIEVLDRILDEMEKHYGYNIKEQVYYSVHFPLNDPEFAGHGRCLNDERLQQILLAFPELYEAAPFSAKPEKAMFQ